MSGSIEADNQPGIMPNDNKIAADNNIAEKKSISTKEMLPEDTLTKAGEYSFAVKKRETVEQDDALAGQFTHYLGRERRKKLDRQIELLYERVANELSDNPKDVVFALENLKKAQGVVLEDMRQYDEALYWVAQVKKMLVAKHRLRRWSYSWGLFLLIYALAWFIAFIAGFFVNIAALGIDETGGWFAALTGGIGGVVAVLYNLYRQVSIRQDFDRQYLMKYLVQPIMGFILGVVMFLIISTGFLVFSADNLENHGLILFQMLLGFVAGFGQEPVYKLVEQIVQRLSPKMTDAADAKEPVDVVPQNDRETLETVQEPAS